MKVWVAGNENIDNRKVLDLPDEPLSLISARKSVGGTIALTNCIRRGRLGYSQEKLHAITDLYRYHSG